MSEPFGPFRSDVDPVERRCQLRCLQGLVRVIYPFHPVQASLAMAESLEPQHVAAALKDFDTIPTLRQRQIVATFAAVHAPVYKGVRRAPIRSTADDDRQDDRTGRETGQTQASSPRT